jgi:hypothetical protein
MPRPVVLLLIVWGTGMVGRCEAADSDKEIFFEAKIRPVLAAHCFRCHGAANARSRLRLDSRAALLRGGKRGAAVVPGDINRSLMLRAVNHVGDLHMPPDKRLPTAVVDDLRTWVNQGAVWPEGGRAAAASPAGHWAFQPVRRPRPPPDPNGWAEHPVDRFTAAAWRAQGIRPVEPAEKRTLLRRIYFDLIGLPPTPDEVASFLADAAPDAYERVVERLLASPLYGERWGRHWMDVVHYADTAGDNADYPVPEAQLYRDYIIDAFNTDKPYDQFVREQIAGDLLAAQGPRAKYAERIIATTYLGLSRRYLTAPYEQWHLTLEDTIDTTGRAFLGMTLRCARCHDHKFDPFTQEDYYGLYGIFASTQFPYGGSEEFSSKGFPREHFVALLPPGEAGPRLAAHQEKLRQLRVAIERQKHKAPQLSKELRLLERNNLPPELPGAYAVAEGRLVNVALQRGGDPERPGPVVPRGLPHFLAGPPDLPIPAGASGRLQLAEWLTSPKNPLTARVLVNRIWQHHFGKGLVTTPSNFGLRGDPPTHPELLDWLTERFLASGWSIKTLHRLIVSSKTYQLASTDDPVSAARDPGNRWYWRFDRRRLDAEALRDALLQIGGHLDLSRPELHPFPPMSAWKWTQHTPFKDVYATNHRSVYLMTQRLQRHPYLALFDGPDTNTTTDTRSNSTVPLQALFFMNNPFVEEQARGLAQRILAESRALRLEHAFQLTWCRLPTAEEREAFESYQQRFRTELASTGVPTDVQDLETLTSIARVLLSANEFVYMD